MTEFNIHYIGFYRYPPEAIHCITYNSELKLLALSRTDGCIEIWNCQFKPFKQQTIFGLNETSVESLVWCDNRLFSAGLTGYIVEYAYPTFLEKSRVATTGGPIWCLALSPNKKVIAAGTEAGFVCLFDVQDEGLLYNKILIRQKNRILSLAWGADSEHLVTGSVNHVHLLSTTTEKVFEFPVGNKETIVWCVALLHDKTIVTGDSRGKTCFWDGTFGTLISSFQTHKADVLTMQVDSDSQTVFVAGVDPVIVEINLVDTVAKHGKRKIWVKSLHRKVHSHDVRSLSLTPEGKLYSGGVDTDLALSFYPPKTAIKYPGTPPQGYISIAKKSRRILLGYKDRVELWRLGKGYNYNDSRFLAHMENELKLVQIDLKDKDRLKHCSVSPSAQFIAFCTNRGLRIYDFAYSETTTDGHVRRVKRLKGEILPSSKMVWIDDQRLLSATYSDVMQVLKVSQKEICVTQTIIIPSKLMATMLSVSLHGSYLAVLDTSNQITVFTISESSYSSFVMPNNPSPVTALGINDNGDLVVSYSDMNITEYNVDTGFCTPFGRYFLKSPYMEFSKSNFVIHNISTFESRVFLHSFVALHSISRDELKSIPTKKKKSEESDWESGVKRKRSEESEWRSDIDRKSEECEWSSDISSCDSLSSVKRSTDGKLSTITRDNHIICFSHFDQNELLCVELNPFWLLDRLPPAMKTKKFGAT